MDWKRSSRCAADSPQCVEVAWQSASDCVSGDCVEASLRDGMVRVRDSKDPDGPMLTFTPAEWEAFLAGAKAGEFDLLVQSVPLAEFFDRTAEHAP